jgi:hypothetical protein
MNNYYFSSSRQDAMRYFPNSLVGRNIEVIEFLKPVSVARFLMRVKQEGTCFFNSNRFIDRLLVIYLSRFNINIIIFQHGRNTYRSNRSVKVILNKLMDVKIYYEIISLSIIALFFIFKLSFGVRCSSIKVFFFTDEFNEFWHRFLGSYVKCSHLSFKHICYPDPLTWGTINKIPRCHYLPIFFVDEPLNITIGLSDELFHSLLTEFCIERGVGVIYVKRHPRSSPDKFTLIALNSVIEYREVDCIPSSVDILIGFKSNLLSANISYNSFYRISHSELLLSEIIYNSKKDLPDINDIDFFQGESLV